MVAPLSLLVIMEETPETSKSSFYVRISNVKWNIVKIKKYLWIENIDETLKP